MQKQTNLKYKQTHPNLINGKHMIIYLAYAVIISVLITITNLIISSNNPNVYIDKWFVFLQERVLKCIELMKDQSLVNGPIKNSNGLVPVQSVPQSPIGVLDAACMSYKSDDRTVGSCANSSHNTPDTKRRKLNRPFEVEL